MQINKQHLIEIIAVLKFEMKVQKVLLKHFFQG
jgi:hypothetical protein